MRNFHFIANNVKIYSKDFNWKKYRRILLIILIVLLSVFSTYKKLYAITPYEITNQNYTLNDVNRFIKSFPNNKFTPEQIYMLHWQCKAWQVHPVILTPLLEKESSIISNPVGMGKYNWRLHRCAGYGLIYQSWHKCGKYYKYGHWHIQFHQAVKAIRKSFDRWESKGYVNVNMTVNGYKKIEVDNVMDYILYRYTPFEKSSVNYYKIHKKFKNIWSVK